MGGSSRARKSVEQAFIGKDGAASRVLTMLWHVFPAQPAGQPYHINETKSVTLLLATFLRRESGVVGAAHQEPSRELTSFVGAARPFAFVGR